MSALSGCAVTRRLSGAVEIVEAAPARRSFPTRVGEGLGLCLKFGAAHEVRADGRLLVYPSDSLCIRAPGCVWSTEATGNVGFLSLDIHAPLLPAGLTAFPMTFLRADALSLRASIAALRGGDEETICDLLSALERARVIAAEELSVGAPRRAAARARERLESDVGSAPRLSALADEAGTNRFALLRQFKLAFGVTPHAFLVTLRVERARQRIARGADLAELAHDLGFADQAHFTRAFKRVVGMTPGEYGRSVRAISFKSERRARPTT